MIRWYDYVLAVLAADFIMGFFLWGLNATSWWEPMVAGLLAGMIWQAWSKDYCAFRLRQEYKRNKAETVHNEYVKRLKQKVKDKQKD